MEFQIVFIEFYLLRAIRFLYYIYCNIFFCKLSHFLPTFKQIATAKVTHHKWILKDDKMNFKTALSNGLLSQDDCDPYP